MSIENSDLNSGPGLPSSDASLTGGSGDGNSLALADLAKGYVVDPPPPTVPNWLPQNANDGENYVGNPIDRGGFAGRPQGFER